MMLFLLACTEYGLETVVREDLFEQRAERAVDWLLVVDDSGSMAPHQARLAEHFDVLVAELVRLDVDLHLGVVRTDVVADDGRLVADVLDPTVFGAAERFAEAVQLGADGSGLEMGLEAAVRAVTEPNRSGANAGFLRADAELAVLFVSDEDDLSPEPVGQTLDALRQAIDPASRTAVTAHALVVLDEQTCTDPAFVGSVGRRYLGLAELSGGQVLDLCASSLAEPLTRLSREVAGLHDRFVLSGWPVPETLELSVDGQERACGEGLALQTRADGVVEVVFDTVPPVGTQLSVRYTPALSPVEWTCP